MLTLWSCYLIEDVSGDIICQIYHFWVVSVLFECNILHQFETKNWNNCNEYQTNNYWPVELYKNEECRNQDTLGIRQDNPKINHPLKWQCRLIFESEFWKKFKVTNHRSGVTYGCTDQHLTVEKKNSKVYPVIWPIP